MTLDKNFFVKQHFTTIELRKYKDSAHRDLKIASEADEPEVMFHFAFMVLIKIGIYRIAREGYRVKSHVGHHQKIIESLSRLMGSEDIVIIGDRMRRDRNLDFYSASIERSVEEVRDYLNFVKDLYCKLS